ncbi:MULTISPECIES: hydrogenase expression/formation protein HypE [Archaeoglobus]|jgi:hydrogenase expression/formation protein HypE|uniref:Hydrogenase expression/formation protein (HypE) n=3 Tax=Archaeoglobus fulgidus TaxID=2234 RepID=O28906_ARCFU|nr:MULTISPECIES: hydrogenase expression/formation protein HypE [Archaeoglobus]AAB89877.1 hydrogenase expression/formation protein (hypE) [Archaeoglobus fulgidus DSM 4304]AIG98244.1 hydrogenase expression/formation protein HypE [Archaeoglobus fulgidus DSM 8774]KUJ93172.1 MAG: Hydrogenase expression/formation protein (HypE) [Archaeoglobus fulgidus]KUK05801.1 MAG: Hydrogenase expression/formation protein (HypE) [Archaeoglobus fulgidus]MDI3498592.1 hydrogenase expression/formation protein HypE [Ar
MSVIRKEDGAGGKYMVELLKKHVFPKIASRAGEIALEDMEDSSDFCDDFAFTTDSYVVSPPIFRGGSIGSLSVCGTSNDLAVMGAKPEFMSLALVIQDGFPLGDFRRIMDDIRDSVELVNLSIITGDTKVVESNVGIIVNTAGIGRRSEELERNLEVLRELRDYPYRWVRDKGLKEGDAIIVSGSIAEHAAVIMAERMGFEVEFKSDVYPVWLFVREALRRGGVTAMKDPTRGGIAAALNEMAEKSGVGIKIFEERIPLKDEVRGLCELLGLDPLTMANEGKVVFGVHPEMADEVLKALHKAGQKEAEIIGYATKEFAEVVLETAVGTTRVVPQPISDPIPRVC